MKKFVTIVIILILIFVFFQCGDDDSEKEATIAQSTAVEEKPANTKSASELSDGYYIKSGNSFSRLKTLENMIYMDEGYYKTSISLNDNYQTSDFSDGEKRGIAFSDNKDAENNPGPINEIKKGDELVLIASSGDLPDKEAFLEFTIEDFYISEMYFDIEQSDDDSLNWSKAITNSISKIDGSDNLENCLFTVIYDPSLRVCSTYFQGKSPSTLIATGANENGTKGYSEFEIDIDMVLCSYPYIDEKGRDVIYDKTDYIYLEEEEMNSIREKAYYAPYGNVQDGYVVIDTSSFQPGYYYFLDSCETYGDNNLCVIQIK